MPGSKTTTKPQPVNRKQVLAAVRALPKDRDFVRDGRQEDDRPATREEMQAARRARGRPPGSGTTEQVALRLDAEVVRHLRASGPGWQTRVREAVTRLVRSGKL